MPDSTNLTLVRRQYSAVGDRAAGEALMTPDPPRSSTVRRCWPVAIAQSCAGTATSMADASEESMSCESAAGRSPRSSPTWRVAGPEEEDSW